jgi:hypothetical protein
MQAIAQPGNADHCYMVHSFSSSTQIQHEPCTNGKLTLPYMCICCIDRNGKRIWVHANSEKENIISSAIGKAIDLHEKIDFCPQIIPHHKSMQEKRV